MKKKIKKQLNNKEELLIKMQKAKIIIKIMKMIKKKF